ncbi:hypothetical protein Trydic_g5927 [Trypoxylus dichotomus]
MRGDKKQVTVTEALPPRLYGLLKIHKRDVPLRPIVSTIGAPVSKTPYALRGKTPEDTIQPWSLFIKVPLIDTLRYIADLFPADITQLFKHCLRTSYFVWDGSFYEQTDGVAIGNPLSPVVANLLMEQFESLAIETAVDKPAIWWRHVEGRHRRPPMGNLPTGRARSCVPGFVGAVIVLFAW